MQNYSEGIHLLQPMLADQPKDIVALFFIGQCYLNTQDLQQAIDAFTKVVDEGRSMYYDDAYWYLSLAYLKKGG